MSRLSDEASRTALNGCMTAIAAGDVAALRMLITLTQPRLKAIAVRLLDDHHEADDVLQDVYMTIWDKAARYDAGRAHAMAWLTVITRNRALDRLRQRAAQRRRQDPAEPVDCQQPEDRLEARAEFRRLAEHLEQLDPATRDAIKAAFFDGMTYEALAKAQDVPLPTMKSRIRRGLLALRAVLTR